jgi:flagellin-like protein
MKKIWAIRKDAEAVSPVIATILMVAITVVLAAVLYVMVLGFGGTSTQTPTSSLTKSTVTGGDKFTFAPMSKDTPWSDASILLTDGSATKTWTPLTTDLDNGTTARFNVVTAAANLGTKWVNLTIVDLAGNGYINQGDYITLTTGTGVFSNTVTYTVTIMHDPSSAAICHLDFQG